MAVVSHLCVSPLGRQFQTTTVWTESDRDPVRWPHSEKGTCYSDYIYFPVKQEIMERETKLCQQEGAKHFALGWLQYKAEDLLLAGVVGVGTSPRKGRAMTLRALCCLEPSASGEDYQSCYRPTALNADNVPAKQTNIIGDKVIRKQDKMLVCFICFPNLPCLSGVGCTLVISSKEAPGLFGHWQCNNYDMKS